MCCLSGFSNCIQLRLTVRELINLRWETEDLVPEEQIRATSIISKYVHSELSVRMMNLKKSHQHWSADATEIHHGNG